jgi:hypothetical protein
MLSDRAIKAARPREKSYKLADGRGLYLIVTPHGGRWWRFRYPSDGREKLLSLGIYPDVSLKDAREKRDGMRRDRAAGVDPASKRHAEKYSSADSFEAVAREWLGRFSPN